VFPKRPHFKNFELPWKCFLYKKKAYFVALKN
jgi:hypothetical protein